MLFKNDSTCNGSCYHILTLHILILSYQDMIKKNVDEWKKVKANAFIGGLDNEWKGDKLK
jgi:hypothetical protein